MSTGPTIKEDPHSAAASTDLTSTLCFLDSSGVFKRLIRLSEIFLFDFKDWKWFQGKAKALLYDYVLRKVGMSAAATGGGK